MNGETEERPWKIFMVNDCDWWVARDAHEAFEAAIAWHIEQSIGGTREQILEEYSVFPEDEIAEVEWSQMFRKTYVDESGSEVVRRSFREELDRRVAAGLSAPELFASTEF